jgi:hypothetical protein
MAKISKKPVSKRQGLTPEMKSNIIKASIQRSINYFMELRHSVDPESADYAEFGKKISAYIAVKQAV